MESQSAVKITFLLIGLIFITSMIFTFTHDSEHESEPIIQIMLD